MAEQSNSTRETRERPGALIEALREAGVDRDLTMRVFECIEAERAAAVAKAARLFYNLNEDEPITRGQFVDHLNNMTRRMWGLVCAVGDLVGDRDDSIGPGVLQIANDVAGEMDRLTEAFEAEFTLAKEPA